MPESVDEALAWARGRGVDRLDAQLLLGRLLDRPRAWLIAHGDAVLEPAIGTAYANDVARRESGEPLAYIVGEKEFFGLSLHVDARVLVPRPDTEVLVHWALERLAAMADDRPRPQVVDLGTGSGAIALALKSRWPSAEVRATDRSADALAVARANGARLGLSVDWLEGDWWSALAGPLVDLAVSNPPYIAEADRHMEALHAEPARALVAGTDGLSDLRRIIAGARDRLARGGWLLLEHGWQQAPAVRRLLDEAGFADVQSRRDLAGHERCTGGHG